MESEEQRVFEEICRKLEQAFENSKTQGELDKALIDLWMEYGMISPKMPCSVMKGFAD